MPDNPVIIKRWRAHVDLLALHRSNPARYPCLLASTSRSSSDASRASPPDRYDMLMAFPQARLALWPEGLSSDGLETSAHTFISALDECWRKAAGGQNTDVNQIDLPFTGGWFLYLGYELAAEVEPTLNLPFDRGSAIPIAMAVRIPAAVIIDRHAQQTWLLCEKEYASLYEELVYDIETLNAQPADSAAMRIALEEEPPEKFIKGVGKVKEYIREGDVFQVNLSRRWHAQANDAISASAVFAQLARTNPAPYAGLIQFEEGAVISSSPERLVRVRQNTIETRPIAGTRPRGADAESDRHNLQELIAHPKERAEHVMLIDLERNDLGRVCRPGTVEVNELMVLESYAHVHHIVSNVRGRLRPACSPGDVIRSVFPGGTITGCPKVRCMAIIAELEQRARGPYTGAMGYLTHNGDLDLNILIRSIVMDKDTISFRAGAGLVADSIAERELDETRAKARGMLLSLQAEAG